LGDDRRTTEGSPQAVPMMTGVAAIAAGGGNACAIMPDKTLSCWGENDEGECAMGGLGNLPNPTPTLVTGVTAIDGGGDHMCAIEPGGVAQRWGWNNYAQPGDNTPNSPAYPLTVAVPPATAIAAGDTHSCVVAGPVMCWGHNDNGEIGTGGTSNHE